MVETNMGGPYKRKKYHYGDTHLKKGWRTKRRTKDLDQIDADLGEGKVEKLLAQEVDFDKAGLGQFYCVHCAKDFINPRAFQDHVKGKPHKRRLHALKTDPYTAEEANRAAGKKTIFNPLHPFEYVSVQGMGSFIKPGKRKMDTLVPDAITNGEELEDVRKRAKLEGDLEAEVVDEKSLDQDGDERM